MARRSHTVLRALIMFGGLLFSTTGATQSTDFEKAHHAMEIARSFKAQGELQKAEKLMRLAMDNSSPDSNLYKEAKDEIEYYLPLARIQRLLWAGKNQTAEAQLLALQMTVENQPLRRQEIGRIMNGLRTDPTDLVGRPDDTIDEKFVLRAVQTTLESYFRRNEQYPLHRDGLLDILAFDEPPLNTFEVERYTSNGGGYVLVLRNKNDANQAITLQNTGLLQPPETQ